MSAEVVPATRYRVAGWRDPRLGIGIAMVAVSVLLGSLLFAHADDTVEVWGVVRDLPAGSTVHPGDLEPRRIRLADGEPSIYLQVGGSGPTGRRLARPIGAGELLPAAALADSGAQSGVLVPLEVGDSDLPRSVETGSIVDVWVTPKDAAGSKSFASRVLSAVRVVAAPDQQDALAPQSTRSVVVLVASSSERTALAEVIGRIAADRVILTQTLGSTGS